MATYDLTSTTPSNLAIGDILNCPYSGTYKAITLPAGQYKFECWGAQGGSYSSTYVGGNGGYAVGTYTTESEITIYLYSGGQGTSISSGVTGGAGGFNGGGAGGNGSTNNSTKDFGGSGGGGASDIRIGGIELTNRIIVAGGGGGASGPGSYSNSSKANPTFTCASGGAAEVAGTRADYTINGYGGDAGTSTAGGFGGRGGYKQSGSNTRLSGGGGGGGAGYYGGGGGGGGATEASLDTGGSDGALGTGGAGGNGYGAGTCLWGGGGGSGGGGSNYVSSDLTNSSTANGATSFIDYSGSTTTGHSGNGAIRITVLAVNSSLNVKIKTAANTWLKASNMWIKTDLNTWSKIKGIWVKTTSTTWSKV